jgi:hypothetical protein
MTTPAVLYDHVPIEDDDEDTIKGGRSPLRRSRFSYFVSSMVHQVSAPLELTVKDDHEKKQNHHNNDEEGEEENIADDDEEDATSTSGGTPVLHTIWRDSSTEYVFVPRSSTSTSTSATDSAGASASTTPEGNNSDVTSTMSSSLQHRLPNINRIRDKLFIFGKVLLSGTSIWNPIVYHLSSYASSLFQTSTSSSIYRSYDWVSETVIDENGNRLVLPGELIVMDGCPPIGTEQDHDGSPILPSACQTNDTTTQSCSVLNCSYSKSLSSCWLSKTIMVSAHDLLVVQHQHQQQQQQQQHGTHRDHILIPTSSLCLISDDENLGGEPSLRYDDDDDDDDNYKRQWNSINASTDSLTRQWTGAIWRFAKCKTIRWYRVSCFCVRQTVLGVERVLSTSTKLQLPHNDTQNQKEDYHIRELAESSLILPGLEENDSPITQSKIDQEHHEDDTAVNELNSEEERSPEEADIEMTVLMKDKS